MPAAELVVVCLLERYLFWLEVQWCMGWLPDRCISVPDYDDIMKALLN